MSLCDEDSGCKECWPDEEEELLDEKLPSTADVHGTIFISECDVQVLCTGTWTLPYSVTVDREIFMSEDAYKYTKDSKKVTCKDCLQKMKV